MDISRFTFWPNWFVALLASTAFGLLSAYFAQKRGLNPRSWFWLGFLLGLFGVVSFFFLPSANKRRGRTRRLKTPVRPAPQPYLMGPQDKLWYYADETQGQVGPMSFRALDEAWKSGKCPPHAFVWHEEMPDWRPIKEVIGGR
jgi:hypothetical protein